MAGDQKNKGLLGRSGHRQKNVKVDITEILQEYLNQILLADDSELFQALINVVTKLWVPHYAMNFLTSSSTIIF